MFERLYFLRLFSILPLVLVHVHTVASQITTGVNGLPQYSGTPVLANPIGVPTLVYNCAKMPSICNNVHANGGQYQLSNLGSGLKGRLATVPFVTLHVDPNSARGNTRRGQSCPGNWKQNHACPEPGGNGRDAQPLVVPEPFNAGGRTVSSGFVGEALDAANLDYHILDPSGDTTGMAWTCDEFPPAFSIEGGLNGGTLASTYCAPGVAVECDGKYTRSEQDFHSSSHGRIQTSVVAAGPLNYQNGIFEFHFITEFVNEDDAYATRVDWYQQASDFGVFYGQSEIAQKRSEWKVLRSRRFHGNGTMFELQQQVDINHGTLNGTQDEDAFAAKGAGPTATTNFADATPEPDFNLKRDVCSTLTSPESYTDQPGKYPPTTSVVTFATVSCSLQTVSTIVGHS